MSERAKKTPEEEFSLLLLLDGNTAAQRLIATWPNAYRSGAKKHEQIATWAAISGLREIEVSALWRMLFENGFVRRDGTVDDQAAKYLRTIAAGRLPRGLVRAKEPEKKGGGK